jgi:hypothetical protein
LDGVSESFWLSADLIRVGFEFSDASFKFSTATNCPKTFA